MTHCKTTLGLMALAALSSAQTPDPQKLLQQVEGRSARFKEISRQIWENPELGWAEFKSSALLKEELRKAGFRIQENVGGLPTAFVAEWGSGKPVIGIIGEFDALPGLSQDAEPARSPRVSGGPGHGCGHNLFGSATALAAVSVKEHLVEAKLPGTIRFYGTPNEEGGAGKVYMIRAGAFKDADVVLAWHPGDSHLADDNSYLANISAKVRFYGKAAHAAGAPEAGRSALDGLELMTHAVNMMREHVPQESRMHYIITSGGAAANIVPDFAELSIVVRHPDQKVLDGLWERVKNCAEAGALGSGTRVEIEIISAYANFVTNPVLRDLLDKNLHTTGGFTYTPEEAAFAEKIRQTLNNPNLPPLDTISRILPPRTAVSSVSTDVGDVSWVVPVGHMVAGTFPPGTPLHSWQSTACAGTEIGRKGLMVAAKALTLSASDLFHSPELVKAARAAYEQKMAGRTYRSLIPEGYKPVLPARP
ncbi:amidohydrolase [uncultured Paludibaculum sp.]|uniref:amidohydrolase n=1 Tax=uncultured Paludibaculum sp. TaxID=1765020 RepID=UPI002AABDFF6|nr:amidohydrolase [uncultured Paludibaculum sp.]